MGYGSNGYQIRIRRIEKIRMDTLSAHIDHTKPSKHNLMYFPITLSSPLKMKPALIIKSRQLSSAANSAQAGRDLSRFTKVALLSSF